MRIAVVQQNGNPGKPRENLDKALALHARNPWFRGLRPQLYGYGPGSPQQS